MSGQSETGTDREHVPLSPYAAIFEGIIGPFAFAIVAFPMSFIADSIFEPGSTAWLLSIPVTLVAGITAYKMAQRNIKNAARGN